MSITQHACSLRWSQQLISFLGLMLLLVPFPINLYVLFSRPLRGHDFHLRHVSADGQNQQFALHSYYFCSANSSLHSWRTIREVNTSSRTFSMYYFLFSSFYLISFAIIGCAIVVELERTARHAFFRERELSFSNNSIKAKNTELKFLNSALENSKRDMEVKTVALVAVKEEARLSAERSNLINHSSSPMRRMIFANLCKH